MILHLLIMITPKHTNIHFYDYDPEGFSWNCLVIVSYTMKAGVIVLGKELGRLPFRLFQQSNKLNENQIGSTLAYLQP